MTRQQIRAQVRADEFARANTTYGLEPRRARRKIARVWAVKEWRKRAAILTVSCGLIALMSLGAATGARAQGSRKDDVVFNAQGRPMAGATVRICTSSATGQPCAPLANIYSDPALTQAMANPVTTDGLGNYTFYAAPGRYEIEISGPNITTKQLPNVILPNDPSTPTFASLSTTSGISAFSLSLGGNLTVSGSAAVTGTLTVGGAPIPSTGEANTWSAVQTFQGPSPWVDVAAYGARAIVATSYKTTCTANSGSQSVTVGSSTIFQNKDGISCYGAGATNTLSTPGAPTVTPSLAAHATGTGVDVNAPSGSTAFSYKVVALGSWSATSSSNLWGAYTAASTAGATTTGNSLGSQTQTISTLSEQNGVLTVTCSAACPMSAGAYVGITGTSNDPFFAGQYIIASVNSTTQFTLNIGNITAATVTATGGTLNWFASNHVTWTAVSGAFEYAIYGRTSGSWTLLGFSWPGVTWWDDFGATMSGNLTAYGWLPTSAPSAAQNGVLTTTVTAGGGTTSLTLAAAASNNVSGGFATFDDAPLFAAASAEAIINGGPLYIPCTPSTAGTRFIIGSYLQFYGTYPINVQQCGSLWLDDPLEWDKALNWFGHATGNNGGAAVVALTSGAEIDVDTAYPGIYSPNATSLFVDHTFLNQVPGDNDGLLSYLLNGGPGVVWTNSTWQTGGSTDYMGIHLIVGPNNSTPDDTFTNDSWISGPNQAANLTTTPLLIFLDAGQIHIDNCTMNRRTIAEVGAGLAIQVTKGCWLQGPITPFVMSNATSEQIGGNVFEGILMDTSGQPIFANWATSVYQGLVEIDSPSLDAPAEVTGAGVANLILKDVDFPSEGSADNGQNQNYSNCSVAYVQEGSQNQGKGSAVCEQSRPNYQAQPNPQNFFIEQLPPAPSSSASAGGSLTGTHYYGVVAHFPGGTSRTGPQGNSVTLSGGNGTIGSTFAAVPGAISYDVWDLTRGLPTACAGITTLTCTDNGGGISASGGQPNAPSDGCPAMTPSGLFNCAGPAATSNQVASAATNFGTAIGSTNVIASIAATGVYNVGGSAYVSTAGAGCSSATNSATVTWAWTDATGTSQTATGPLVSVTGNSTLGATTVSGPLSIVAEAGTAISYSVASTLGSTGCSTTPRYTVQVKGFN